MVIFVDKKSNYGVALIIISLGSVVSQLIPFMMLPIITRLYSPEAFGVFNQVFAICLILAVISSMRYEQSIMLAKPKYVSSCIFLACLVLLTVFVFNLFLIYIFGFANYYLPIIVFLIGIFQVFQLSLLRYERNMKMSIGKVSYYMLIPISQVLFFYLGFYEEGLFIGFVVGATLAVLLNFFLMHKLVVYKNEKIALKLQLVFRRYRGLVFFNAPSSLVNVASTNMPLLVLALKYNSTTIGIVSLAIKALQAPVSMLSNSISHVIFQISTKKGSKDVMREKISHWMGIKLLITFPFVFIIHKYAEQLFSFAFGKQWEVAGEFAIPIAYWVIAVFVFSPYFILYNVLEKHTKQLNINVLMFLMRLSSLLIPMYLELGALEVVTSFCVVSSILWALVFILSYKIYFQSYKAVIYVISFFLLLLTSIALNY